MKVISFGRASSNDVVVNDPMVSSNFHMKIEVLDNGHVRVVDCGSTNGTFVNGRKIPGSEMLKKGDIIRIGNSMIPWENYVTVPSKDEASSNSAQVHEQTNGMAIAGFVCSFFVPIVGVIFSAIALNRIKMNVTKKGKGLAIAGLVISIVGIAIWLISIIALATAGILSL